MRFASAKATSRRLAAACTTKVFWVQRPRSRYEPRRMPDMTARVDLKEVVTNRPAREPWAHHHRQRQGGALPYRQRLAAGPPSPSFSITYSPRVSTLFGTGPSCGVTQ